MNVLQLRTGLATVLTGRIGTYTLPNGATTPAISVRAEGEQLPVKTSAAGLEVVIIRTPTPVPIPQYDSPAALRNWTVFLVGWSKSTDLETAAALIVENYPGTRVATVPTPKGSGPSHQMRLTILSNP